ncbi:L,D-transpeptidase family protein [Streptomyces sp. NBC_00091]|uniref:L,D-transpeptidase family protein n=1 Tax=Streptomyces sp. NBC_00091 TaxID=2975648 RepID=UPI0022570CE0|nr:L,D-transpeptidase family protein [Streptomyces sp. NBC_00091]MCX5376638.1 L,D-transpeptidase family protein [Streptomyces sp. NBC_00091]
MKKHARARSRFRTGGRTPSRTGPGSAESRRSASPGRPPRALLVVAALGLLTFGAGWVHAVYEQPGAPAQPARSDARPQGQLRPQAQTGTPAQPQAQAQAQGGPGHATRGTPRADALQGLPDSLSAATRARIPGDARQLVLVTGKAKDSSDSAVTFFTRTGIGADWTAAGHWPARNGANGWSTEREYGDLTSPQGVFSLTDAGGLLPAPPGTKLPYDRDPAFVATGLGVNGESLAGSFDYVVAIDYNRRQGMSPLDPVKPEGEAKGGNIWLHVDHNGPSHGCVGLPKEAMEQLLKTLDPAAHPVIAMGPAGF